jgi:hypothetical protein
MRRALLFLTLVSLLCHLAISQVKISAAYAKDHIGKEAIVCGTVASTRYAETSRGRPTFLHFGQPYPNHVFTVVIWGDKRQLFGQPELKYANMQICVSGTIEIHDSKPQIVAQNPCLSPKLRNYGESWI